MPEGQAQQPDSGSATSKPVMLTKADFRALLARRGTLIIDGALATELEVRGHDLNHALWSGKVLQHDPDSIQQVHLDYYLAGADIAITASYQASTQGLLDHFGMNERDAKELIKRSVRLAQRARVEAYQQLGDHFPNSDKKDPRRLLIAGSVGPYGAYLADGSEYRGHYRRSVEDLKTFHRPRIQALVDAGVDLLAVETMPDISEIVAVCELLKAEFPDTIAWVSCTLKDPEHLSDGSPLEAVMLMVERHHEQIVAFGVNCVPVQLVMPALQHLSTTIERIGNANGGIAPTFLCYPNSGEIWNAESKTWHGPKPVGHALGNQAKKWRDAGAKLIGGCCKTGPKDTLAISKALREG